MKLPTKVGIKTPERRRPYRNKVKLVLSEVNFNEEEEVYKAAKMGLAMDGQNQASVEGTEVEEVEAHPRYSALPRYNQEPIRHQLQDLLNHEA